jgi:hypothetical protein
MRTLPVMAMGLSSLSAGRSVYGTVRTSSWESGYSLYACPRPVPSWHKREASLRQAGGEFFLDGNLTIRGITTAVTLALGTPEFGANP